MNFNSIKVQLEQHNGKRRDTRDRYFNSIKVQLEPYEYKKVDKYFLTISIP